MFRWYRIAKVCYAFLSDAPTVDSLPGSRWFTRGWTLQELVAPAHVRFYNNSWEFLGSKLDLKDELHHITTIEKDVLVTGIVDSISIARRMAWAAARQTTRIEDRAYSLMGIFDVNMPLLYGEGEKAFTRLQEAIMRVSDDQSLFAWGMPAQLKTWREYLDEAPMTPSVVSMSGIFAPSPAAFTFSDRIHILQDLHSTLPPIMSGNGVRIELQIHAPFPDATRFAVLYCTPLGNYESYLGFPIIDCDKRWAARCGELVTIAVKDLVEPHSDGPNRRPEILFLRAPIGLPETSGSEDTITFVQNSHEYTTEVHCATHAAYESSTGKLTLSQDVDAAHAVFIFSRTLEDPELLFEVPNHSRLIDKVQHKSSFVMRYNYYAQLHRYTAAYPTFAVLLGGRIDRPWVQVIIVLEEEDTDEEFQRLHGAAPELVKRCATKQAVLSMLNGKKTVEQSQREAFEQSLIMSWHESHSYTGGPSERVHDEGRVMVSAQVGRIPASLVEHGIMLFVNIGAVGSEPQSATLQGLKWWEIRSAS